MNSELGSLFWTIAGIFLGRIYDKIIEPKFRMFCNFLAIEKKKKLYFSQDTIDYLGEYYGEELYNCKINRASKQIAFITNDVWANLNVNVVEQKNIVESIKTNKCTYPIRQHMIDKRQKAGQVLVNGPSLFLHRVKIDGNNAKFEVGEYEYYRRISFVDDLEKETFKWIYKNNETPIRDKYLPASVSANMLSPNTIPFGCSAVVAIKLGGRYHICIHKRSEQTVNYPGAMMVVPSFGFDRVGNVPNSLLFAFLREYAEELFDRQEMSSEERHVNRMWFYLAYKEIQDLFELMRHGKMKLILNGCGYDAIGGFFELSLLAVIEDEKASWEIYSTCKSNWETAGNNLQFISIDDPKLETMLKSNRLSPCSAFSISRAIDLLNNL